LTSHPNPHPFRKKGTEGEALHFAKYQVKSLLFVVGVQHLVNSFCLILKGLNRNWSETARFLHFSGLSNLKEAL